MALFATLMFTACDTTVDSEKSVMDSGEVSLTYDITKSSTYSFDARDSWTIDTDNQSGLYITPMSGSAGNSTLSVQAVNYNNTNEVADYSFNIVYNSNNKTKVSVHQNPVFVVDSTTYHPSPKGEYIYINFTTLANIENGIYPYYLKTSSFDDMVGDGSIITRSIGEYSDLQCGKILPVQLKQTRASSNGKSYALELWIAANWTNKTRVGTFDMSLDKNNTMHSAYIDIEQLPNDMKCSTDTITNDGKVYKLQTHTKGNNGMPIVIMGDGFIDTEVADGTYENAMKKAYDALFSLEPMASMKDYFDVYYVTAVSFNNVFSSSTKTKFGCWFESGSTSHIEGNQNVIDQYAQKAVTDNALYANALDIVVLNVDRYAGTCLVNCTNAMSDVATGTTTAYIPLSTEEDGTGMSFSEILQHEAVGHGIGKLADEYTDSDNDNIQSSTNSDDLKNLIFFQKHGCYRNVDTCSVAKETYWKDFVADTRYSSEEISCYEGGYAYQHGVYRSTQTSIMNVNVGGFNAPSRRAIYNRCMYVANGKIPTYEQFVDFDASIRATEAAKNRVTRSQNVKVRPLGKPIMVMKNY